MQKTIYIRAINDSFFFSTSKLIIFLIFLFYILLEKETPLFVSLKLEHPSDDWRYITMKMIYAEKLYFISNFYLRNI